LEYEKAMIIFIYSSIRLIRSELFAVLLGGGSGGIIL